MMLTYYNSAFIPQNATFFMIVKINNDYLAKKD
jgi:hypothetical protein